YINECLLDEVVVSRYRLHRVNKKLIHLTAVMLNEKDQLCAIYETILGHIDMDTRKTAEMTGAFFDNLHRIMLQHTKADIGIPLRLQIKEL
ncbi:thioesterase family protein, partial [Porticoccaceae bacterium]|nr:thioesterase family protein [Porticoccaceae bacterium]